jgi:hypothetical protein
MLSNLSPQSVVRFYLSKTKLDPTQEATIHERLQSFSACWDSHGQPLKSSFEIIHHHLIAVAVDASTHASGCSLDKLTHTMQAIEADLNIPLFDRQVVLYQNKNGQWDVVSIEGFKEKISDHSINAETLIYDLTIQTTAEYMQRGVVSVQKSWLKKYLPIVLT